MSATIPKLAVLTDFPEENWPSMDLVAEMLLAQLQTSRTLHATRVCAQYKKYFSFLGGFGRNLDRLRNRMRVYPKHVSTLWNDFDLFHLCDHSYSQLLHKLPADRTGVMCHDLDTFRCILDPKSEPRPKWFRAMARTILTGMQKAKVVFYITAPIRDQIVAQGLIDPARLVWAPPAAAPEYTPDKAADAAKWRDLIGTDTFAMHVGSCIARKRIDVLLDAFAAFCKPDLKLVQIGGEFTAAQLEQINRLKLSEHIVQMRNVPRTLIATLYRNAKLVLQPSDAEGFGLPVVEALACGTPVLASDIPVLRQVGGDAVAYAPVGDVARWATMARAMLEDTHQPPAIAQRLSQAAKFSWATHAQIIASTYLKLGGR